MNRLPLALKKARLMAAKQWPYYSAAIWRLSFYEAKELKIGSMATDAKWRCYYNPEAIEKLTPKQLGWVLAHEINHCLRLHHKRVGDRAPLAWNVASDMEINDDLGEGAFDDNFKPFFPNFMGFTSGKAAEVYYDLLKDKIKVEKVQCGSGCHGAPQPWDLKDDKEDPGVGENEQEMIRHEVARALKAGTEAGRRPLWVEETLAPKVDWRKLMSRFLRGAGQVVAGCVDYTYTRPSRRSWGKIILPRMISKQVRTAIVVDTSGSMNGLIATALAEVRGIAKTGNMDAPVFFVDSEVASKGKASGVLNVAGGGGTDMRVGIEAALASRPKPDVVVVLTDGYTPWPSQDSGVPLIIGLVGEACGFGSRDCPPEWAQVVEIVA